ncbi:MAG: hypothetical protein R2713_11490 [Ilumatobacteraceae bacterium]
MVLFVGRIQPLKGPDVAVRASPAVRRTDAQLLVVGGASVDGAHEVRHLDHRSTSSASATGCGSYRRNLHHILSTYRAAGAVVVPSRSEASGSWRSRPAACGIGGGQRRRWSCSAWSIAHTGCLVTDRDPDCFAAHTRPPGRSPARRRDDSGSPRPRTVAATHLGPPRGRATAPPVRRPHRPQAGGLPVTDVSDDGRLAVVERQIDEWLAGFRVEPGDRGDRSGERRDRLPLVRAHAVRPRSTSRCGSPSGSARCSTGVRDARSRRTRRRGVRAGVAS